ncbi:MAG: Maf family protein [Clostridia bacterium]|nr:Maf family protein [Clostridia bacterium]
MLGIVLASASPRRTELLKQIGIEFKIIPSNIEEDIKVNIPPEELVQKLSYEKALDVAKQLPEGSLVIGADTIVVKDGVLGKPANEEQAFEMLKSLQGRWHEVITGVTVINSYTLKSVKAYEKTRVKMRELSDSTILSYIKTREPMDKAGSYGIQGIGAVLVEKIEGCYFNVVGLPLTRLSFILEEFGVSIL